MRTRSSGTTRRGDVRARAHRGCVRRGRRRREATERRTVVRFAFSPDPVIDWMNDQGIIPEYEEQYNVRLVTTSSWDEFAFFAGGHGDIVSMATYETPLLEQETGIDTVTFGSYNNLRVPVFVRADSDYETFEDLAGHDGGRSRAGLLDDRVGDVHQGLVRARLLHRAAGRQRLRRLRRARGRPLREHGPAAPRRDRGMRLHPRGRRSRTGGPARSGPSTSRPPPRGRSTREEYADGHKGLNGNNFVARKDWFDEPPERGRVLPRALGARDPGVGGAQGRDHPHLPAALRGGGRGGRRLRGPVHGGARLLHRHRVPRRGMGRERDGRVRPHEGDRLDGSRTPRSPSSRSSSRSDPAA